MDDDDDADDAVDAMSSRRASMRAWADRSELMMACEKWHLEP